MILKFIGLGMIILACSLTGFQLASWDKKHIDDLTELKKGMTLLKGEILFASNSLREAFQNIKDKTGGDVSEMFSKVAEALADRKEGMEPLWEKAMAHTLFTKEDKQALLSFAKTLGYLDRDMQKQGIDLLLEYIDTTTETLRKLYLKNAKMYHSMGVLAGLLLAVILV